MKPERTNLVEKYGNASRLKKKSVIRPTLPYFSVDFHDGKKWWHLFSTASSTGKAKAG